MSKNEFDGYRIVGFDYVVVNNLFKQIKDLWIRANAGVPDIEERIKEVVAVAIKDNFIVGVVTRRVIDIECQYIDGKQVSYIREFIGPYHRSFKLHRHLFWFAVEEIKKFKDSEGIVLNTENKKFQRKGYQKRFEKNGFKKIPSDLPYDVWYLHFTAS